MRFRSCDLVLIPIASLVMTLMQSSVLAQGSADTAAPATNLPAISNEELMMELRKLRTEVQETRRLKDQVIQLRNEVANLRPAPMTAPAQPGTTVTTGPVSGAGGGISSPGGSGAGHLFEEVSLPAAAHPMLRGPISPP